MVSMSRMRGAYGGAPRAALRCQHRLSPATPRLADQAIVCAAVLGGTPSDRADEDAARDARAGAAVGA
jgi:hypothetical protein